MSEMDEWKSGPEFMAHIARQMKAQPTGAYETGYAKPPVNGRFKPGQSGNPKGRPKMPERSHTDRQKLRDLIAMFNRPMEITINGKKTRLSFIECIYEQAAIQAAKGNFKYFCKAVELYNETIEVAARLNPGPTGLLNGVEARLSETGERLDPALEDQINKLRRRTRRL